MNSYVLTGKQFFWVTNEAGSDGLYDESVAKYLLRSHLLTLPQRECNHGVDDEARTRLHPSRRSYLDRQLSFKPVIFREVSDHDLGSEMAVSCPVL